MNKNSKHDLRWQKSKKQIIEAFFDLVESKGYSNVSVSDITKHAKINRNTFYLHYTDKENLVKEVISESLSQIDEVFGTHAFLAKTKINEISESHIRYGFRTLLKLMEPHLDMYRIILLDKSMSGYIDEFFLVLKEHFATLLDVSNPRSNLVYEYAFSGMTGIIRQWVIYSPLNSAFTAKYIARLSYLSLQQFNELNKNID